MANALAPEAKRFVKQVSKRLCCANETKSKLTDGIVQELAERYSGQDSLSYDALLQDFGSPDEIALEMQENVNPQEVVSVKKKRKVIAAALIVLAVVAFLAFGYVTWNVFQDQQTWAVEQIRDYTP